MVVVCMAQLKTPYRNRGKNTIYYYYHHIHMYYCNQTATKCVPCYPFKTCNLQEEIIYDAAAAPVHTTQSTTLNIIIKVSNLIFIYFSQTNIESFASLLQAFKKDYIEHKSDK